MKYIITGIFIFLLQSMAFPQGQLVSELKVLYEDEEYNQLIDVHASKTKGYPAKAVFYVGMAYYMRENYSNCLKMMNVAIEKDSKDAVFHYMKATVLNQLKDYKRAIPSFEKAIKLDPEFGEYYCGLGDTYLNLADFEKAMQAYQKASQQEIGAESALIRIGQLYIQQRKYDLALASLYMAKKK